MNELPAGAPDLDTADVEDIVEYLRDMRVYLNIEVFMSWVSVKRTYRIWPQGEADEDATLLGAVKKAAARSYKDILGVDRYWDALIELAKLLHTEKKTR